MQNKDLTMTHLLFVDPFSSAHFLATKLKSAGIRVSAIYTLSNTNNYLSMHPELFDQVYYLNQVKDLPELIKTLSSQNIDRVYYGSETSVAITDYLANILCPAHANSPATANYRTDKYEMQEALRQAGIPSVKQIKVTGALTAEQEAELSTWDFPVILKPVNNAGSNGVECCDTVDHIKFCLSKQDKINVFGLEVNEYVIQEYLQGEEYIIDTFSIQGQHHLSGVLRTCRSLFQGKLICLYSETVSQYTDDAIACIEYVKKCLTAVGLENGFGHTEVMMTDKGPYLIEVNPRISGACGYVNKLFQACGYYAQIDLLIASCQGIPVSEPQNPLYGRRVCLQNYEERVISDLNLPLLDSLPSFVETTMLKQPGTLATAPQSLTDTVAFLLLAHEKPQQVLEDYQRLIHWEQNLQLF